MPKELFPSSYECDCGHQSHFSERVVREIKAMSMKKEVRLGDSQREPHTILFHKGDMVAILCPKRGKIIARRPPVRSRQGPSGRRARAGKGAAIRSTRKAVERPASFEHVYPSIARWVTEQGWIEMGQQDDWYQRAFIRALDAGGMVWEGKASYKTVEAALQALEAALAAWWRDYGRR